MPTDRPVETNDIYLTPSGVAQELGTCTASVTRWILTGVKLSDGLRLRLRADRLPGGWRIRRSWVQAFVDAYTADRMGQTSEPPALRSPARRAREFAAASAEADRLGL